MYSIKQELFDMGITTLASPTGRMVRAYNMERTICDIIRIHKHVEIQDFQSAMKAYARRPDKNLPLLLHYAQAFGIEKVLRQYMEVLL